MNKIKAQNIAIAILVSFTAGLTLLIQLRTNHRRQTLMKAERPYGQIRCKRDIAKGALIFPDMVEQVQVTINDLPPDNLDCVDAVRGRKSLYDIKKGERIDGFQVGFVRHPEGCNSVVESKERGLYLAEPVISPRTFTWKNHQITITDAWYERSIAAHQSIASSSWNIINFKIKISPPEKSTDTDSLHFALADDEYKIRPEDVFSRVVDVAGTEDGTSRMGIFWPAKSRERKIVVHALESTNLRTSRAKIALTGDHLTITLPELPTSTANK